MRPYDKTVRFPASSKLLYDNSKNRIPHPKLRWGTDSLSSPRYRSHRQSDDCLLAIRPHRFSALASKPLRSAVNSKAIAYSAGLALFLWLGTYYATDTRSGYHRWFTVPLWQAVHDDAEEAHESGVGILQSLYRLGIHPRERSDMPIQATEVLGYVLSNPMAVSAGLDKGANLIDPLFALGPAIVEVGGVTPLPQDGNARPRVWRLPPQNALVNRYGLNSEGADRVASRLQNRLREYGSSRGRGYGEEVENLILDGDANVPPGSLKRGKLLAIQIAKNKSTPDHDLEAVERDYIYCVERLAKFADIITVNVSSPNTPGLRNLQKVQPLTKLLTGIVKATKDIKRRTKPHIMVKISPDEDLDRDIRGVCEAVWRSGVDGVIVGNTTKLRPDLANLDEEALQVMQEPGGYSGPMSFGRTLSLIERYRKTLDDPSQPGHDQNESSSKVIFASGGISNAEDAFDALRAGASVVMVYTSLMYEGAGFFTRVKNQLNQITQRYS